MFSWGRFDSPPLKIDAEVYKKANREKWVCEAVIAALAGGMQEIDIDKFFVLYDRIYKHG